MSGQTAVTVGSTYTGIVHAEPVTTARSFRAVLRWFTAAGVFLSSSTGSSVLEVAATFTKATVTAVAPATAAFAEVAGEVLACDAHEQHRFDMFGIIPGSSTTYTIGGLIGETTFRVKASDDDGDTFDYLERLADASNVLLETDDDGRAIVEGDAAQLATVYDHEAPPGAERLYVAVPMVEV